MGCFMSTPEGKGPPDAREDPNQAPIQRRRLSLVGEELPPNAKTPGILPNEPVHKSIKEVLESDVLQTRPPGVKLSIRIGSISAAGFDSVKREKINQDACTTLYPFDSNDSLAFFGVWDGHGVEGRLLSQFAAQNVPKNVSKTNEWAEQDYVGALISGILKTDAALQDSRIPTATSGTTAVHALLNTEKLEIYCANVGDSRCMIARELPDGRYAGVALSEDHKPDLKEEKKRIQKAKGRVQPWRTLSGEEMGPARVWLKDQNMPGLAMSRSLGDFLAKSVGVIAEAEVKKAHLGPQHRFMVLASDGVWEFISCDEVCEYVRQFTDPEEACRAIIEESQARWREEEDVVDDITAIVVFFDWQVPGSSGTGGSQHPPGATTI
eukprot:TRINITY_DN19362_c0_g1::TRINITY_DN19362_c0_g1_i1::g.7883::m.7883 TRINITY_DN19362_c0_g1::TRINITY_DN19362_c0_g1_i1::g.7883  ORF type:complete len:380 (-),score=67.25,sp/Q7XJ53/P2C35_ARATH/36.67/2e-49,PP2C/PF00481.16/5e-49,SpoIIE/PF07228.7/0.69,SpoIIE/PF07228.7/0.0035 TRINITY_DN19362_c0_g1_i1:51-1190(-)